MIDEELYQLATDELNGDQRRPDIWARACALASDDHDEARYLYTNLRVEQLLAERAKPRPVRSATDETESLSSPVTPAPDAPVPDEGISDTAMPWADENGVESPPAMDLPDLDEDVPVDSSSSVIDEDVTAQDITTHDFRTEDLTPDDFAARTIDMSNVEALDTAAPEHPLPRDEPGRPLPEPEAVPEAAPADSGKPASSYWDDDDFSFELVPLDTTDTQPDEPVEASRSDTVETAETKPAAKTSSTRSGVDADSTARLTESDMASFTADFLDDDDGEAAATSDFPDAAAASDSASDTGVVALPAGAAPAGTGAHTLPLEEEPDDDLDGTHELPPAALHEMQHAGRAFDEPLEPSPVSRRTDERTDQRPAEDQTDSSGRSWLVYRREPDELRAVKNGVCWPALFVTLPWLLHKLLLGTAVVYSILWLILVAGFLVSGLAWLDAGPAAPLLTPLLFAGFTLLMIVGLFYVPFRHANAWHARKLERRGYSVLQQVNARTASAAVNHVQAFRQH